MAKNPASPKETEQLMVTLNAENHEIVKVEKVNKSGDRAELSTEEYAQLAGEDEVEEIEIALEAAFDAGVVSALDEDDEDDEDDEGRVLQQLLIAGMLKPRRRSIMSRFRRRFIHQLILPRLIRRQLLHRWLLHPEETQHS